MKTFKPISEMTPELYENLARKAEAMCDASLRKIRKQEADEVAAYLHAIIDKIMIEFRNSRLTLRDGEVMFAPVFLTVVMTAIRSVNTLLETKDASQLFDLLNHIQLFARKQNAIRAIRRPETSWENTESIGETLRKAQEEIMRESLGRTPEGDGDEPDK